MSTLTRPPSPQEIGSGAGTNDDPARATTGRNVVDSVGVERSRGSLQLLTLVLDGITAGDYLCWVRDPEPAALGAICGS